MKMWISDGRSSDGQDAKIIIMRAMREMGMSAF